MKEIKEKLLIIFILCGLFLVLFIIGEFSLRAFHKFRRDIPFSKSLKSYCDKELGWKGKVILGNSFTKKLKVFIIGDSYTWGGDIKEEDMYYNEIRKSLNAELFIYGGGGYGTLQEYIVIDKYFDSIKPDLIILQTCNNDFINNLWELESKSYVNNNELIRPYLIDGQVKYIPFRFLGRLAILIDSRLLYLLNNRLEKLLARLASMGLLKTVEKDIGEKGVNFSSFKKSVAITDILITKIRNRVGDTPVVAFSIDDAQPYLEQFRRIFKKNNILFIESVAKTVQKTEIDGIKVRLEDGHHWNKNGHKICGNILVEELKKQKDSILKNYLVRSQ